MADVPEVTITDGVPTGGSGTVQTLSTVNAALNDLLNAIIAFNADLGDAAIDLTAFNWANILTDTGPTAANSALHLIADEVHRARLTFDIWAADTAATLVGGDIAHDAADSGNPFKLGGKAIEALSGLTLVAANDRVNASFDLDGALIVRNGGAVGDRISARATNTSGAVADCIAAQAAGIKVNLTDVTLSNSHATQFCTVDILDGATVKWTFPVPPVGGVTHRFETPLTGTAATAWRFDPSAATTTITCSMAGRLSKI